MTTKQRTAVHFYLEDGFLVRGTLDPCAALGLAFAEDDDLRIGGFWQGDVQRHDDCTCEVEPDAVKAFADYLHGLVREARPGLYRIVPVGPNDWRRDDGYAWMVHRVNQRGPGVFEAVEFP